jgi:hypothetical protein
MLLTLAAIGILGLTPPPGPVPTEAQVSRNLVYRPSGGTVDLLDLRRLARLRTPGARSLIFTERGSRPTDSANHRTSPTTRTESNDIVLAEIQRVGIIQRLEIGFSEGGDPASSEGRLLFVKPGSEQTLLELSIAETARGRNPGFPRPLVIAEPGRFVSTVPIPFGEGCRVLLRGSSVQNYLVEALVFSDPAAGSSTSHDSDRTEVASLQKAKRIWEKPSDLERHPLHEAEPAEYVVDGEARSSQRFLLPDGPATLRSLEIRPAPGFVDSWRSARLRIVWDDDAIEGAGIDLPAALFFGGHAVGGRNPESALVQGQSETLWYNRYPMPYRRTALLQIDSDVPIRGVVKILAEPTVDDDAGYLRAAQVGFVDSGRGCSVARLRDRGRGHLVGLVEADQGSDANEVRAGSSKMPTGRQSGSRVARIRLDGETVAAGEPTDLGLFRLRVSDPLVYTNSFEVDVEVRVDPMQQAAVASERPLVGFWYSERPGPVPEPR